MTLVTLESKDDWHYELESHVTSQEDLPCSIVFTLLKGGKVPNRIKRLYYKRQTYKDG